MTAANDDDYFVFEDLLYQVSGKKLWSSQVLATSVCYPDLVGYGGRGLVLSIIYYTGIRPKGVLFGALGMRKGVPFQAGYMGNGFLYSSAGTGKDRYLI